MLTSAKMGGRSVNEREAKTPWSSRCRSAGGPSRRERAAADECPGAKDERLARLWAASEAEQRGSRRNERGAVVDLATGLVTWPFFARDRRFEVDRFS